MEKAEVWSHYTRMGLAGEVASRKETRKTHTNMGDLGRDGKIILK